MHSRDTIRSAGALVSAQLHHDDEGASAILNDLDHPETAKVALLLASWSVQWLHLVCTIGGVYADDPVAVMQEFLLEQAQ